MERRSLLSIMISMLVGNVIVWIVVRYGFLQGLKQFEQVQATLSLLQGMLLFDSLIMLWLYTDAARRQVDVALLLRRESNKPIVVTVPGDNDDFYLQNIGPGVAINCSIVVPVGLHDPNIHEAGAVAAKGEALNPIPFRHLQITPGGPPSNHLVVAEALYTRTQQWIVTLNVLHGNEVVHRMAEFSLSPQRISLREFLDNHFEKLVEQLRLFETELGVGVS